MTPDEHTIQESFLEVGGGHKFECEGWNVARTILLQLASV
jgi:hypothetical protein